MARTRAVDNLALHFCHKLYTVFITSKKVKNMSEEIDQQDEERAMKEERETEYAESYQHPSQ